MGKIIILTFSLFILNVFKCTYKYTLINKRIENKAATRIGLLSFEKKDGIRVYAPEIARRLVIYLQARKLNISPVFLLNYNTFSPTDTITKNDKTKYIAQKNVINNSVFAMGLKNNDDLQKIKEKLGIQLLISVIYEPPSPPLTRTWAYDVVVVDLNNYSVMAQRRFISKTDSVIIDFLGIGYKDITVSLGFFIIKVRDYILPHWYERSLNAEIYDFFDELETGQSSSSIYEEL